MRTVVSENQELDGDGSVEATVSKSKFNYLWCATPGMGCMVYFIEYSLRLPILDFQYKPDLKNFTSGDRRREPASLYNFIYSAGT